MTSKKRTIPPKKDASATFDGVDEPATEPRGTTLPPLRSEMPTLTDELELEKARLDSKRSSPAPRRESIETTQAVLELADALASSDSFRPPVVIREGDRSVSFESEPPADPRREMRERYALDDFSGAFAVATRILELEPRDAEAAKIRDESESHLRAMLLAKVGPLTRVPFVAVPTESLRWLSIDHRAGFVLSHVDGASTLESILDVCGMPVLDALRILVDLLAQRVIAFRGS